MCPVNESTAMPSAAIACTTCEAMATLRQSRRSASTPAGSIVKSDAPTNAVESIATGSGLFVRSIMSHASPTFCTNEPMNVTMLASQSTRNAGRRAANARS